MTWTKVTQNTGRTYPNDANDIAVVEGDCQWAKMLVDADISIHAYIVGARTKWVQLETKTASTLTFCGTESDPARFHLTGMSTNECQIRIGPEKGTDNKVLNINVAAKRMIFDWCGDSSAAESPCRGNGKIQWCSAIMTIPEGSTLEFVNDSQKATDSIVYGNTAVGHIVGEGTIVAGQRGGIPFTLFGFADDAFSGDLQVHTADWKGMVEIPDATLTIFGAPNADRKTVNIGYDTCTANPGRSQIDVQSVTLNGGCLRIYRNYSEKGSLNSWTNDVTSVEELMDRITVTNDIKKLVLRGDSAMYCECSYGTLRVRQHVILHDIERDDSATLCLYDFNFRDKSQRTDMVNYDRVKGEGLAEYAVGRDPQEGDSQFVYKIIPWIACTANDNGFQIYNTWGSEMTFPALVDGQLFSKGRTNCSLNNAGEWDNVYFNNKGISISADKTINSLAYNTAETAPYPGNLVLGEGKTLTIRSGGLIMARTGRWLGCTQTANFAKNGSVAFGARAYVISDFGKCNGDCGNEYNVIWTQMTAPYGLTKGGCGELVLATDQRGIDGDITIGGGTLWLGHPANYTQQGWLYSQQASNSATIPVRDCATDVETFNIHAGGVLAVPLKGYDADGDGEIDKTETAISKSAVINLQDNAAGTAKIEIAAGADQVCANVFANGKKLPGGTYGSSATDADYIDDLHFLGTGKLSVIARNPGLIVIFL